MNGPRFLFLAVCCGVVSAAPGCTQIAGLGGDYQHVTSGGSGAQSGAGGLAGSNAGAGGTTAGTAGDSGSGDDGGAAASDGGGTGGSGGSVGLGGSAAGRGGSVSGSGGSVGGTGGDTLDMAGQGGEPAGAGGTAGNGASGGMSGTAGGGGTGPGPVRVGYSKFSDSATNPDHANGQFQDATFKKPSATQEGDFMLVFIGVDHQLYIDDAALGQQGWTVRIAEDGKGMDGQGTYVFSKVAGASEMDPILFQGLNPEHYGWQGLLTVYRGVNRDNPIDSVDIAGADDMGADNITRVNTPTPALTTDVPHCLLLAGLSPDTLIDAPVIVSWPDGFGNELSVQNMKLPYPYGWANIYLAERTWDAAATFPASSIAWDIQSGERYYGAVSFLLALAPEP